MSEVKLKSQGSFENPSINIYFTRLIWVANWINVTIWGNQSIRTTKKGWLGGRGEIGKLVSKKLYLNAINWHIMREVKHIIHYIIVSIHVHPASHARLIKGSTVWYNNKEYRTERFKRVKWLVSI